MSFEILDNRCHGDRPPFGRSPFLCFQASNGTKECCAMSKTELTDNLTFAAAVQMLAQGFLLSATTIPQHLA